METGGGYIKLFRKAQENFLYRENRPHTRREAWEDILLMVNHTEVDVLVGGKRIICGRGQSIRSLDSWAKHFNWSKSKVKRFFDLLKSETMIVTENVQKTTRLTVCNYDAYQGERNNDGTMMAQSRPTNKNDKKNNKDNAQNDVFDDDFLKFWNIYNKKKDRLKCEKKFAKLTKAQKQKIFTTLPTYVASTPDPQYRKNPLTYLNAQSWDDEIETPTPTPKSNNNLNLQEYYGTK